MNRWTLLRAAAHTYSAKTVEVLVGKAQLPTLVQVGTIMKDDRTVAEEFAMDLAIEGLYPLDCGDHWRVYNIAA